MSQRSSGYEVIENDFYATPAWVTENLLIEESFEGLIWEPACGKGHILEVLKAHGYFVIGTDIIDHRCVHVCTDFLTQPPTYRNVITNPPYGTRLKLAQKFVEHALAITKVFGGKVAMLLPVTFDSGKTRRHLFVDHPAWKKKIVLTDRIAWANIEETNGSSTDHAWFIWDWDNEEDPITVYQKIPKPEKPKKRKN